MHGWFDVQLEKLRRERGQATVLIVCFLPIFVLLMGWSVDIGRIVAAKAELAKATDIAAQEVAKEINMDTATQTGEQCHSFEKANVEFWIEENLNGLSGGTLGPVTVEEDQRYVYIESEATIPLYFSALAGKSSTVIRTRAIGRLRAIKSAQSTN